MKLWQVLDRLARPAYVMGKWRMEIGEEVALVEPYFLPWPKLSMSYPSLDPVWPTLEYDVIVHSEDNIVGICRETEDRIELKQEDLVVYEMDIQAWLDDVATAFGWNRVRQEPTQDYPPCYRVGDFRPTAGYAFPVFFTVPMTSRHLTNTVCKLVSMLMRPFVLVGATGKEFSEEAQTILGLHRALFLPLSDSLVARGPRGWEATPLAQRLMRDFAMIHVPELEVDTGITFFPTPQGARWSDVEMRVVDGHTLSVRVGDVRQVLHYTQMGLADGRNANPTKQWELLLALARSEGLLTWRSPDASRRNKKRRSLLSQALREFFRIEEEPIGLTEDGSGWQTAFRIRDAD